MRIKAGEDKEAIKRRGNNLFQNIRYRGAEKQREKDRSRGGENEKGEKRRDGITFQHFKFGDKPQWDENMEILTNTKYYGYHSR